MERFCPKCGSLVEGSGVFCPACGEKLESAVDLSKPMTTNGDVMPTASQSTTNSTSTTYANPSSNSSTMPNYPQTYNAVNTTPANEMTVGQWVLTIFLSGLGIVGLILLFVWAFGSEPCIAKKNYARAMLIWYAIGVAISLIYVISIFACGMGIIGEIIQEIENAEYTTLAVTLSSML